MISNIQKNLIRTLTLQKRAKKRRLIGRLFSQKKFLFNLKSSPHTLSLRFQQHRRRGQNPIFFGLIAQMD
ncbi:hypothetical protein SAMN05444274_107183 [Mariniphaga anaerophila]|uniref:Uncharacterized protein n=1 Tax=Mariniphaga anaerophila TaxID=1484053 RepID=A0A1M5DNW9_9BACT|nr:hypothetical protein SAMN05444274_107183 [Mariniphaga anaerophila]